jgi:hypothetical protein
MNASCRPAWEHADDAPGRRGVLLLIVLSMLTLFLMLGATYLVVAIRARETARAYARLTFGSDEARIPHARLLDNVALGVVRGGVTPSAAGAGGGRPRMQVARQRLPVPASAPARLPA